MDVYVWAQYYDYEGYNAPQKAHHTLRGAQIAVEAEAGSGTWNPSGDEYTTKWGTIEIFKLTVEA